MDYGDPRRYTYHTLVHAGASDPRYRAVENFQLRHHHGCGFEYDPGPALYVRLAAAGSRGSRSRDRHRAFQCDIRAVLSYFPFAARRRRAEIPKAYRKIAGDEGHCPMRHAKLRADRCGHVFQLLFKRHDRNYGIQRRCCRDRHHPKARLCGVRGKSGHHAGHAAHRFVLLCRRAAGADAESDPVFRGLHDELFPCLEPDLLVFRAGNDRPFHPRCGYGFLWRAVSARPVHFRCDLPAAVCHHHRVSGRWRQCKALCAVAAP